MNDTIIKFLEKQTCATICCVDEGGKPYCFSCFYAFNAEEGLIYFKSSAESYHSILMKKNSFIAGTILPDKLKTLVVKGVQFEGDVVGTDDSLMKQASAYYHKRHPLALAMSGDIWIIQMNNIKMTDSTMGFGKKITWSSDEKVKVMV